MFRRRRRKIKKKWTLSLNQLLIIILVLTLGATAYVVFLYRENQTKVTNSPIRTVWQTPSYLFSIYGGTNKPLKSPMAICVNKQGNIYVANTNGHEIQVFNSKGEYLFSFGRNGSNPGEMKFPYGIVENSKGNILVADTGNARIQEFSPKGNLVGIVKFPKNTNLLQKPGPMYYNNGKLYVGDLLKQAVIIYDENKQTITSIANLNYPHGISTDQNGNIYVADSGNYRIAVFNKDAKFIKDISKVKGNTGFSLLRGLAVDQKGRIYAVDSITSAIRIFSPNGKLQFSLGNRGFGDGEFLYPTGLFLDNKTGYLLIADWANNRVQVWK